MKAKAKAKAKAKRYWQESKTVVLFVVLMLIFRSAVADWSQVPTGSMKPTILEGDHIFINKLAYDLRLPFTHISLWRLDDPERGDIIIFDSAVSEKRLVKRVVGLPGDTVAMVDNTVLINGQALQYASVDANQSGNTILSEDLLGSKHNIQVSAFGSPLDHFHPVSVPDHFYLVLGDNRNNSADSRVIGLVPRSEIVGRSNKVIVSLNYENYYLPRSNRIWQAL